MGKYALLIGVGEYGEGLQPLPAAPLDVAALAQVLQNPDIGGFDDIQQLANPSQPEMARAIELWFSARQPEDLVLLFFSGHGVRDDRRDLYFTASNTEKVNNRLVRSTATPARFVHDCIRGCKARQQVIILDCCFSGAFGELTAKDDGEIDLESQLGAEGRVVLTSTSAVDYSFEDKGADLSIYTRYLVEGLQTGAADADGDGVIVVEELHRYASRKVAESSPAMTPKIITLKDEGYRIALARSPQDDPRLKYRKEVEQRARKGTFSRAAKRLLNVRRVDLGLAEAEAEAIEAEVLKPYQDYQRKLQDYRQTLAECLEDEGTLSPGTIQDLQDLWQHQRLKLEDVVPIEQEMLGQPLSGAAAQRAAPNPKAAQPVAPTPAPNREPEDDLSSEKGIDYSRLRDLLKAGKWREADQETAHRMLAVVGRKSDDWIRAEELKNFPCKDLRTIDGLWVKYSQGKWGFSVQKQIYVECGAKLDGKYPGDKIWYKFCQRVGWRKGNSYVNYSDLTFDLSISPTGEFPVFVVGWWVVGVRVAFGRLFSRIEACKL